MKPWLAEATDPKFLTQLSHEMMKYFYSNARHNLIYFDRPPGQMDGKNIQ
jgi:hypothetical protein